MPEGFDFKNLLTCAGQRTGGVSVCPGDSGGGLLLRKYKSDKKTVFYTQIGITQGTYNDGCDTNFEERYPSIYTRTENLDIHNFIRRTIGLIGNPRVYKYSYKLNIALPNLNVSLSNS